jgi:hypothetical protein
MLNDAMESVSLLLSELQGEISVIQAANRHSRESIKANNKVNRYVEEGFAVYVFFSSSYTPRTVMGWYAYIRNVSYYE